MKIFLDALRIDDAVVAEGYPRLPAEKGHVTVQFEKLPPDCLPTYAHVLDDSAADEVLAEDLVEVVLVGHAIEDFVGPDEKMGELPFLAAAANAEATGWRHLDLVAGQTRFTELPLQ